VSVLISYIDLLPSVDVEAGEVFCGLTDSPLSTAGLRGLKKAVRRRDDWQAVITSPRSCCTVFAEWLARKHDIPAQTNEAFAEMNFGEWEGQLPCSIMINDSTTIGRWWRDPAAVTPPNGESFNDFQQRVLAGWQQLIKTYRGQTVLLVTHPGVVRMLLSEVLHMPSYAFFSLQIENGYLSRIRVIHDDSGDWANVMQHGCQ